MSTIKPIETVYNGYRFRSRLEARWAVFFDTLGVKYEYEKEGFSLTLPSCGEVFWYLPDFWLPNLETWIEIKGQTPTMDEVKKCHLLARTVCKPCFLINGSPWLTDYNLWVIDPDREDIDFRKRGADMWPENLFVICLSCQGLGTLGGGCEFHPPRRCRNDNVFSATDHPRLIAAYTAARQARFERGG